MPKMRFMLVAWPLLFSLAATATTTTTSPRSVATHTVKVGSKMAPHAYVPHSITAAVGDIIVFEFYPTNHSVAKADFLAPCVPASAGEFYSGNFNSFNLVNGEPVGPPPTWSLVVNDTEPVFFYCTAIDSCTEYGMVGVINPNSTETWEKQYKRALTYPLMLAPGQAMPAEGGGTSTTSSSSYTSSTASASTTSSNSHSLHGRGLSRGAIAGIAIACMAFVGILVALFFTLGRNCVYRQWMSSQAERTERTARWAIFGSHGQSWPNQPSELFSNPAKPASAEVTLLSTPESSKQGFSPPPGSTSPYGAQTHWSWDSPYALTRGPTELEAHSIVRPPSKTRDYE